MIEAKKIKRKKCIQLCCVVDLINHRHMKIKAKLPVFEPDVFDVEFSFVFMK